MRLPTDGHNDARALYVYMKVFSPGVLDIIPEDRLKPVYAKESDRSWVYTEAANEDKRFDVRVIHDAWDVPLDYMLYVKCEWSLAYGKTDVQFNATARTPALRSRGIDRETFDAVSGQPAGADGKSPLTLYADQAFYSVELPKPYATVNQGGVLEWADQANANGWVRGVAAMGDDRTIKEDYGFRPDKP